MVWFYLAICFDCWKCLYFNQSFEKHWIESRKYTKVSVTGHGVVDMLLLEEKDVWDAFHLKATEKMKKRT